MIEVGQKLWCAYNEGFNKGKYVEVVKIGRKWITLSNGQRADKETLKIDGGRFNSLGQCYISKTAYDAEQERLCLWREFRSKVNTIWRCPSNLTVEKIDELLAILKGERE